MVREMRRNNISFDQISERWAAILDDLDYGSGSLDLEVLKHLIFDTYHFYRNSIGNDKRISGNQLAPYKNAAQLGFYLSTSYVTGASESEQKTCECSLLGLCFLVEQGFDTGYNEYSLPLNIGMYTPGGCAPLEANMATYESFEKEFAETVEMFREDYDME